MQERDIKILDFISKVRFCTNEDIQNVFFKGLNHNVCYRRLSALVDSKLIKRSYYHINQKNIYIYYLDKKPSKKILPHDLLITKFLVKLMSEGFEILEFEKNPHVGNIIPDAKIKFKTNHGIKHLYLEVQLSQHDCIKKYYNLQKKIQGDIPNILYIVTNNGRLESNLRDFKIVIDNLYLEKLSFYFS